MLVTRTTTIYRAGSYLPCLFLAENRKINYGGFASPIDALGVVVIAITIVF